MFKAKRIDTGEIETILAVDYFDPWHQTYFLTWSNNAWRWRPAHKYIPPGIEIEQYTATQRKIMTSGDLIDKDPPF